MKNTSTEKECRSYYQDSSKNRVSHLAMILRVEELRNMLQEILTVASKEDHRFVSASNIRLLMVAMEDIAQGFEKIKELGSFPGKE